MRGQLPSYHHSGCWPLVLSWALRNSLPAPAHPSFLPHHPHLVCFIGPDSSHQLSHGPTPSPWESTHASLFLETAASTGKSPRRIVSCLSYHIDHSEDPSLPRFPRYKADPNLLSRSPTGTTVYTLQTALREVWDEADGQTSHDWEGTEWDGCAILQKHILTKSLHPYSLGPFYSQSRQRESTVAEQIWHFHWKSAHGRLGLPCNSYLAIFSDQECRENEGADTQASSETQAELLRSKKKKKEEKNYISWIFPPRGVWRS